MSRSRRYRGRSTIRYRRKTKSQHCGNRMTRADQRAWKKIGLEPGDLPTGVIVGTVEVVGCRKVRGEYQWDLAKPVRLKPPLKPKNHPQPAWFYPF